jgi:hypothetical protein
MSNFPTYRLKNQKGKGYKGLYKKLFDILDEDSIFIECAEEESYFDGEDMIILTTWSTQKQLPKGIERIN